MRQFLRLFCGPQAVAFQAPSGDNRAMSASTPPQPLDYASPPPRPTGFSPWLWVPALFFMQAVPNAMVVSVYPVAFKNLGFENLTITAWTPLVVLPWTLKLLWAPLVELTAKKRTWVLLMQVAIFLLTAASAAGLMLPTPFYPVLAIMMLLAICSATHDIASDGLYLLSLPRDRQAAFVGVLTTAGRLGRLLCTGGLVWLAGYLAAGGLAPGVAWAIVASVIAAMYGAGMVANFFTLPTPPTDLARLDPKDTGRLRAEIIRTASVIFTGLCLWAILAGGIRIAGHFSAATLDMTAKWGQTPTGLWVWLGIALAGFALFPLGYLLSRKLLRGTEMGLALSTYVTQPGFGAILFFILTYRLGEVMVGAMSPLFLLDTAEQGGLNVGTAQLGTINGVAGVIGIIIGGLVGGWFISKVGLRKAFWPLAFAMHTPNLLYVYAAYAATHGGLSLAALYGIVFIDQFGYGFGFAGYFVYLMYVAQRRPEFTTTHYAIGTGLGALTIVLATALSGIVQSFTGYFGFFIIVCFLTLPGMIALLIIPMDETEGRGIKPEVE